MRGAPEVLRVTHQSVSSFGTKFAPRTGDRPNRMVRATVHLLREPAATAASRVRDHVPVMSADKPDTGDGNDFGQGRRRHVVPPPHASPTPQPAAREWPHRRRQVQARAARGGRRHPGHRRPPRGARPKPAGCPAIRRDAGRQERATAEAAPEPAERHRPRGHRRPGGRRDRPTRPHARDTSAARRGKANPPALAATALPRLPRSGTNRPAQRRVCCLQTRSCRGPKGGEASRSHGLGRRRLVVYEPEPARPSRHTGGRRSLPVTWPRQARARGLRARASAAESTHKRAAKPPGQRWCTHPSWHYVYCPASSRAVARPARDGRGNHLRVRTRTRWGESAAESAVAPPRRAPRARQLTP